MSQDWRGGQQKQEALGLIFPPTGELELKWQQWGWGAVTEADVNTGDGVRGS